MVSSKNTLKGKKMRSLMIFQRFTMNKSGCISGLLPSKDIIAVWNEEGKMLLNGTKHVYLKII
jgi:hypothetical protein